MRQSKRNTRARPGLRFVIIAGILSVSLFGILRIPFVEKYLLLPFTKAQHGLACRIGGDPEAPITVGLSCSASDVIALCLGFILAFPVSWSKRLLGAVAGLGFIAAINTVRIATLSHAVRDPRWFDLLHVYLWPGVLLVVVSLFVFLWMSYSLRAESGTQPNRSGGAGRSLWSRVEVRFVLLTLLFVAIFVGTSGWWMHSKAVLAVAHWVAAAGAAVIRLFGGEVRITGNVLRTATGGFAVTQECIMTPLIPAYFAAVFALKLTRGQRITALLMAFPVFFVLGAARLLVLAFPTRMVGSHLVAIHGFYQFLLAAVLIFAAVALSARIPRNAGSVVKPAVFSLLGGALVALVVGWTYRPLLFWLLEQAQSIFGHAGHGYRDPQGALWILVPYQLGLAAGLWIAWQRKIRPRRVTPAWIALIISQPLLLVLIGETASHTGIEPHVAAIRALTVLAVLLLAIWVVRPGGRRERGRSLAEPEPQHG